MERVPVVFLDRDGVINEQAPPHQYITRWEDFRYLPGVHEAIKKLNDAGYRGIIVSNQRCIARGMLTVEGLEALNRRLLEDIEAHGGKIEAVYYCPHDVSDNCGCRKPKTGMLEQAEKDLEEQGLEIRKEASWMVGDFRSDIQTGMNYGINTVHILSGGIDTSDSGEAVNAGTEPSDSAEMENVRTEPSVGAKPVNVGTEPSDSAEPVNRGTGSSDGTDTLLHLEAGSLLEAVDKILEVRE